MGLGGSDARVGAPGAGTGVGRGEVGRDSAGGFKLQREDVGSVGETAHEGGEGGIEGMINTGNTKNSSNLKNGKRGTPYSATSRPRKVAVSSSSSST